MPSGEEPRFVLLYGSQKGQAQSIAEGVAEVAEDHGLVAELSCLDTDAKVAVARSGTSEFEQDNTHIITSTFDLLNLE